MNVERVQNALARFGFIEHIKVDAGNSLVDQLATLSNGVFHTNFELGLFIVLDILQLAGQSGRNQGATHRRDSLDTSELGNRHNAGNERDLYPGLLKILSKTKERLVIEKELSKDGVGS